jgi:hypothetical protein
MNWSNLGLDVLQDITVGLNSGPGRDLLHGNTGGICDLPSALQAHDRDVLVGGSRQPSDVDQGVDTGVSRVDCYTTPRGGCDKSDRHSKVAVRTIGWYDGSRDWNVLQFGPVVSEYGQVRESVVAECGSVFLGNTFPP